MRVSHVISRLTDKVQEIIDALDNRLTAADNFGPEGEVGQVLTSRGPRPSDPPPSYQTLADILQGIPTTTLQGIPGLQGPAGPVGPAGPQGLPGSGADATHAWQPLTMVVAGVPDLVYDSNDELIMIYAPL